MKKIIVLISIVCTLMLTGYAQETKPANNHAERIEAEKVAFLTKQLDLSVAEAQAFWPVYNKVEKEQKALGKAEKEAFKALSTAVREKKSEKEISELTDAYIVASQKNSNAHLKAKKEYEKVLSPEKVAKFYLGCERFRRQQFQKLKGSQAPKPQGSPSEKAPVK